MNAKLLIGFIGQGFVGRHLADDFENRGYEIVRYSKETPYDTQENKTRIGECDVVFIAVPTPTNGKGFDDSIIRSVLALVCKGKIVVIKSSILPGVTDSLQTSFPDIFVFHAPEFLTEANAAYDAAHPNRNIIGIPRVKSAARKKLYEQKAHMLASVLPASPRTFITTATEAEMIKYLSNCFLALKIVYSNIGFDIAESLGADYSVIAQALGADERIGTSHLAVAHGKGRGAGGNCFIKDLAAFRAFSQKVLGADTSTAFLAAAEAKNIELLATSGKDTALLSGVYGKDVVQKFKKH